MRVSDAWASTVSDGPVYSETMPLAGDAADEQCLRPCVPQISQCLTPPAESSSRSPRGDIGELGRIERSLFMLQYIRDPALRRRISAGLA